MAVTTTTDLNGLYNTIYERALFVAREMNLMTQLVDNRSATGWMSRVVPIRPTITAVSVGETEDFNAPTTFGKSTLATLTPGEIMAQVVLTDRDVETDPDSAVRDAEFELGSSIAVKIDTDLMSLFDSFTTDKGDGTGQTATFENFAAAVAAVRAGFANQYGTINAVLHPYHWHDLWLELGKPAATYANLAGVTEQALRQYFITELLGGVRIYTSSNVPRSGSDAISGLFVRPAIMLDTRRAVRMEQERDASARATELNINAGYAYGIVRNTFGGGFTADATAPA